MQWAGTLRITRYNSPGHWRGHLYLVVFNADQRSQSDDVLVYRCPGDVPLLRVLEDLVQERDARVRALEQLRDLGHVAVPGVVVASDQVAKYEPEAQRGPRRRLKPACAVCARPVAPTDGVFGEEQAVHHECHIDARDWPEEIAGFLRAHDGQPFCHSCLTFLFATTHDVTRNAIGVLRARGSFIAAVRRCAACRRSRLAIYGARADLRGASEVS